MPAQDRVRAEAQPVLSLGAKVAGRPLQLGNQNSQQYLFETRKTLRLVRLTRQHAHLLSPQQNLEVFLRVRQLTDGEKIYNRRKSMTACEPEAKNASLMAKGPVFDRFPFSCFFRTVGFLHGTS